LTLERLAAWPARSRLTELAARVPGMFGFMRETIAWLKARDRLGVPALAIETDWHPGVLRFVHRSGELEIDGAHASEVAKLVALFGHVRRLVLHSSERLGPDVRPWQRALAKVRPDELVMPDAWRKRLG
jgi:hypothetical protein